MQKYASNMACWLRLLIALAVLAMIWLVVLPFLGSQPSVFEHIANLKQLNVDPSAMFYSELEIAPAIGHRAERIMDANSNVFWGKDVEPPR